MTQLICPIAAAEKEMWRRAEQKALKKRVFDDAMAKGRAEARRRPDYVSPSRNPYSPNFRQVGWAAYL